MKPGTVRQKTYGPYPKPRDTSSGPAWWCRCPHEGKSIRATNSLIWFCPGCHGVRPDPRDSTQERLKESA